MNARGGQDRVGVSERLAAVPAAWPWEALEELEAHELRLYALGWGDHLPVEVRERIAVVHRRRLELEAQLEGS